MRHFPKIAMAFLSATVLFAQADRDFSGVWRLDSGRSQVQDVSVPPARMLSVSQTKEALTVVVSPEPRAASSTVVCPLDGSSKKNPVGDSTWNVVSKWEGSALLMNVIVNGPVSYSLFERWVRTGDGSRLTITRTVTRPGGETESVLVYENPAVMSTRVTPDAPQEAVSVAAPGARRATSSRARREMVDQSRPELGRLETARPRLSRSDSEGAAAPSFDPPREAVAGASEYVVGIGTKILMRLTNALDTKHTSVGDLVYLETEVPVYVRGRLVIPVGSNVTGVVTEAQKAGKIKGKAALNLRFQSVVLPNGVTRDFRGRPSTVEGQGNLDKAEGRVQGEGKSGTGARTVAATTAGAGLGGVIGAAAGSGLAGAGIGAAAGAAAGLAGIFGGRNADVVLRPGTTIELVLDRDLVFAEGDLLR